MQATLHWTTINSVKMISAVTVPKQCINYKQFLMKCRYLFIYLFLMHTILKANKYGSVKLEQSPFNTEHESNRLIFTPLFYKIWHGIFRYRPLKGLLMSSISSGTCSCNCNCHIWRLTLSYHFLKKSLAFTSRRHFCVSIYPCDNFYCRDIFHHIILTIKNE